MNERSFIVKSSFPSGFEFVLLLSFKGFPFHAADCPSSLAGNMPAKASSMLALPILDVRKITFRRVSMLSWERELAARSCRYLAGVPRQRSGFPRRNCLHGVRNNRSRLRCPVEPRERICGRLPDELEDRGNHAQKARGINRCFHYLAAFL